MYIYVFCSKKILKSLSTDIAALTIINIRLNDVHTIHITIKCRHKNSISDNF